MEQQTPCIVVFGRTMNEITDVKVVIESINILRMNSLSVAMHCCFASYYIYNISYPSENSAFLFVFGTICLPTESI